MTDTLLRFTHAGPHVTLQDPGRPGLMRFGVPNSGPMDRLAFSAAQAALGNPSDSTAIEVSSGGLAIECLQGQISFAVTGGGFILDHAGQRIGGWQVAALTPGQSLTIRPGPWGAWAYLALAGRIDCPRWLGSTATHALSGLGGGRLTTGQQLAVTHATLRPNRHGPIPCPVAARPRAALRVTLGPQEDRFAPDQIDRFLTVRWAVTDARDRMGTRLSGPALTLDAALAIPSEPVLRGSVQVAGDGVATVLMADHQTTGGYPKIATVIDADLDAFAQTRPGQALAFHPVSAARALSITRRHTAQTTRWLATLCP